jgi:asparagine synthase (glutamine-hydrolysing)
LPFLSRAVLQLAARLRPEAIVSPGGVTKPLLRSAFDGRLPASILSRRRAVGFAVPVLPWLRELGEWSAERLARAAQLPFHDGPGLETLRATLQGGDIAAWRTAFIAWRWISLVEWADAHGVEFG